MKLLNITEINMIFNDDKGERIRLMCRKISELAHRSGKLDEEDLDRRLAALVCDELLDTDIKFKPLPSMPDALAHYKNMSKDQQFRVDRDEPDWRNKPTIQDYLRDLSAASTENDSNVFWLKHWMAHTDPVRAEKFRKKLREFNVYAEAKFKPNANVPEPDLGPIPEEVKAALDLFGGTIVKGM